jgi:hypothetical protein
MVQFGQLYLQLLVTARRSASGAGTQTAALMSGGYFQQVIQE